jgi:hypothetical protein
MQQTVQSESRNLKAEENDIFHSGCSEMAKKAKI